MRILSGEEDWEEEQTDVPWPYIAQCFLMIHSCIRKILRNGKCLFHLYATAESTDIL